MPNPTVINRCKYCKTGDYVTSTLINTTTPTRIIYCRQCGTQGDRKESLAKAIRNWNELHPAPAAPLPAPTQGTP